MAAENSAQINTASSDGVWQIADKADNFDAPKMHQITGKPRSYAISIQSIMGATQKRQSLGAAGMSIGEF